jgi:hypothetical protein
LSRYVRFVALASMVGALILPAAGHADPMPVYVCQGTAPAYSSCTQPAHDQVLIGIEHGSVLMGPEFQGLFVGRVRSTLSWSQGSRTGARSYYCDLKTVEDFINPFSPLGSPNCGSSGAIPPDCTETVGECTVKVKQSCKVTAYKSDSGSGSGPWECDSVQL